jgi:dCMP deaminase
MNRISRNSMFMQVAEVVSRRSTCFRRNVGAVITEDHNIVAIGYNGSAPGAPHCTGNGCADPKIGCQRAIHAELNAILHVAEFSVNKSYRMYVTESPCAHCAETIVKARPPYHPHSNRFFKEVFFLNAYRLGEGRDIIMRAGIKLYRMTPSGMVIDCATEELVDV